jgi:hypothetical protein
MDLFQFQGSPSAAVPLFHPCPFQQLVAPVVGSRRFRGQFEMDCARRADGERSDELEPSDRDIRRFALVPVSMDPTSADGEERAWE